MQNNSLLFKTGRGFYEFTKPEVISHKKEVVLVDRATGDMFTGKEACDMIGGNFKLLAKSKPPTKYLHENYTKVLSKSRII